MISFDRGSTNLNAVWNEINSIKSDTASMWDFVSTISGGGGGVYFIALSDVVASSLKYVYNLTGDITTMPTYDSFTLHGNIGNFNNLSIDASIKNFEIGDIDLASGLTISTSLSSDKFNNIKLFGKTLTSDNFKYINTLELKFNSIDSCTFHNILCLSMNNYLLIQNSISSCYDTIFCKNMTSNTLSSNIGYIYGNILSKNSFIKNCQTINAFSLYSNTFDSISNYELNCKYMNGNYFNCGPGNLFSYCTPNFICSVFWGNTIQDVLNDFNIDCLSFTGNSINNSTILGTSTINTSRMINIKAKDFYRNSISNVWNVNIDCLELYGNLSFGDIHSIKFKAEYINWAGGHVNSGGMNNMTNIGCLDIHEITNGFSIHYYNGNYLGVETLKLNYNVSWTNPVYLTSGTEIQPSNFYTLDFYDCENYLSNSTFIIPPYYSGYDEGNVWISGKPLSELGYTLSVSS